MRLLCYSQRLVYSNQPLLHQLWQELKGYARLVRQNLLQNFARLHNYQCHSTPSYRFQLGLGSKDFVAKLAINSKYNTPTA